MKTLKFRFFSISAKIVIVYISIIVAFAVAFLANYYMSKVDIENKLTKVNEEYFINKVSYIKTTFKDIKNNAYDLRNYMTSRRDANLSDSSERFEQINRLSRLINYYNYIDDVFIYNTETGYFISTQGSIGIDVYFRMSYHVDGLEGKWDKLSESKEDIVANVTKLPADEQTNRKVYYKRILYIDIDHLDHSDYIVGFIINIDNIIKTGSSLNADINNFFVIKNDAADTLRDFIYATMEYNVRDNLLVKDGAVGLLKLKNNYVYYQYDNNKELVYLNVVNMDQYYSRLGYFNVLPVILTALLLILAIAVASSFLSKFYKNLKSIRSVIEGDFIKNILEKNPSGNLIDDVKDFIGLSGIRQINVMMLSAHLKSVNIREIETHDYYRSFEGLLDGWGLKYKCFPFIKLKRIYIIDAKSIKGFPATVKALQKSLNEQSKENKPVNLNIFISGIYNDRNAIEKAINEVLYLNENVPVNVKNKVILIEDAIQEEYKYMPEEFKNILRNSLAHGDKQGSSGAIADLIANNINNGVNSRNLTAVLSKINNILLETIFEKYTENYDDAVRMINKINNLVQEIDAEYLTPMYEEVISMLDLDSLSDNKGRNKLRLNFENYISENFDKDIYLETMAEYFNLSAKYISSKFKEITGVNFTDYLKSYRINAAKEMLRNTQYKINEISERVGYNNVNVFIRHFKSMEGITPKTYREIN